MTRSAIKHKLCGFLWVAKRLAKRRTSNVRDTTYGGIKSSQTKYPVEGGTVNTEWTWHFQKKLWFSYFSLVCSFNSIATYDLQFVIYFNQRIVTKQMTFNCSIEKNTETKKKNKTILLSCKKWLFSYENHFALWKVNHDLTFKHEISNVCLLNYLLSICICFFYSFIFLFLISCFHFFITAVPQWT